eukprot:171088_1
MAVLDDSELNAVLLIVSNIIFTILCIIAFQELCSTSITDNNRCILMFQILFFIFLSISSNSLMYLSALYPDYKLYSNLSLSKTVYIIEAITIIFGTYIFRIFELDLIDRLYTTINYYPPRWIKWAFSGQHIFVAITAITCYILQYTHPITQWIFLFYCILCSMWFIQGICMLFALSSVNNILDEVDTYNESDFGIKIKSAKRFLHLWVIIDIIMLILCATSIALNICVIFYNLVHVSNEHNLGNHLIHSIFLCLFNGALVTWKYQSDVCCNIPNDSICSKCCRRCICGCCKDYQLLIYVANKNNTVDDKQPTLLNHGANARFHRHKRRRNKNIDTSYENSTNTSKQFSVVTSTSIN